MTGTALFLALLMAAAPLPAQEITAELTVQPITEFEVGISPKPESSEVEVPESLKATLRLLRTPGPLHPELSEVLGLDDDVGALSVLQEPAESPEEEDEGLPGWAWVLIGVGIGVGALGVATIVAIAHS